VINNFFIITSNCSILLIFNKNTCTWDSKKRSQMQITLVPDDQCRVTYKLNKLYIRSFWPQPIWGLPSPLKILQNGCFSLVRQTIQTQLYPLFTKIAWLGKGPQITNNLWSSFTFTTFATAKPTFGSRVQIRFCR
jgi:hypothetical protein